MHILNCVLNTELLHGNSREQLFKKVVCKAKESRFLTIYLIILKIRGKDYLKVSRMNAKIYYCNAGDIFDFLQGKQNKDLFFPT